MAAKKSRVGGARPGSGRPAFLEDRRSVTLYIDAAKKERLGRIAIARDVSVSDLLREAIDVYLQREREKRR